MNGAVLAGDKTIVEFSGEFDPLRKGLFLGRVKSEIHEDFLDLFKRWEEIVSNQVFSILDEIETEIETLHCSVVIDDAKPVAIEDLQICPSGRTLSFRTGSTLDLKSE